MEQTINLNSAECIRSATNWGQTTVINICSGTTSNVPWGTMDYLCAVFLVLLGAGLVVFLLGMAISFVRMAFD